MKKSRRREKLPLRNGTCVLTYEARVSSCFFLVSFFFFFFHSVCRASPDDVTTPGHFRVVVGGSKAGQTYARGGLERQDPYEETLREREKKKRRRMRRAGTRQRPESPSRVPRSPTRRLLSAGSGMDGLVRSRTAIWACGFSVSKRGPFRNSPHTWRVLSAVTWALPSALGKRGVRLH